MFASLTFESSLAYAELYMVFGLLIRRMGSSMSLFGTGKEDVEIHYDRFGRNKGSSSCDLPYRSRVDLFIW
jgi:hypothetical protein